MELKDRLKYRLSMAVDFLSSTIKDDSDFVFKFKNGFPEPTTCSLLHCLYAASSLYLTEFLEKPYKHITDLTMNRASDMMYTQDDFAFIIEDVQGNSFSSTNVNIMMALLHHKRGEVEQGAKYAATVVESIGKEFKPFYHKATDRHVLDKYSRTEANYGLAIITFMKYFESTREADYLHYSEDLMAMMIDRPALFHPQNMWALTLFDQTKQSAMYIRNVISFINGIRIDGMTSLIASMAHQCYNASEKCSELSSHGIGHREKLLARQESLQVDVDHNFNLDLSRFQGSFVKSERSSEIRIDYLVNNISSLAQRLGRGII